jgi:alpha-amylase
MTQKESMLNYHSMRKTILCRNVFDRGLAVLLLLTVCSCGPQHQKVFTDKAFEAGATCQSPLAQPLDAWRDEVMYALFVDRFYNGDPTNDPPGVKDGGAYWQGGDLEGVIQKLDYIKSLGATTVVLNPIYEAGSYHGYDVLNHYRVSPYFGDMETYRRLIREAHARGLKVLFDLVMNHVSSKSPLYQEKPQWFRPAHGYGATNEGRAIQDKATVTFYGLPDFDQRIPEVYTYLLDVAKFWLCTGVDGFRMDAVTQIEPKFWEKFNHDIKRIAGEDFFILGEIFEEYHDILNQYIKYFDAALDFRLYYSLAEVLTGGVRVEELNFALIQDALYVKPDLIKVVFIGNHDLPRFFSSAQPFGKSQENYVVALERLKQALAVVMTTRGVPYLLYGDEIALPNNPLLMNSLYDRARSPMIFNRNEEHEVFAYLRKLILIRRQFDFNRSTRVEVARQWGLYAYAYLIPNKNPILIFHNMRHEDRPHEMISVKYFDGLPKEGKYRDLVSGAEGVFQGGYIPMPMKIRETKIFELAPVASKQ